MKRKSVLLSGIFLFGALVMGIAPVAAQGIILPPPDIDIDPGSLIIDFHRVNVSIENQIATTNIELQFTNKGERLAEGTFLFPLPRGAAVDQLTMFVDGEPIEARILEADEARDIYIDTVRRLVDPALLEYVGSNLIQARIFPIPANESRRLEIAYGQVLEIDNGLIQYIYPLNARGSKAQRVDQMSIRVDVKSNDAISSIYSPSHNIAIRRDDDNLGFRVGFEANDFAPDSDFSLYYGLEAESINVNLLTYRESADQDGFFMLLVQPPISVPEAELIPKDVIIVLDQSGSMSGQKWEQAREAARFVLENLNPRDRFNAVVFSTGWRIFSNELLPASEADGAIRWINDLVAEGGTDINGALLAALSLADSERPTTILFMTDGLATEGETIETPEILANLREHSRENSRIFTFGVGDDVDTFLLDGIAREHRGTGSYVRPTERIDEEVASLYNKISAPVLNNADLEIDGVVTELLYPQQLNDLFAGEQIVLVGRYRGVADNATITLRGAIDGEAQDFVYPAQEFPSFAGGEPFIARLWATRRIGDLLTSIRLNGESKELVDSIVNLSIRYGIITPYTSFLIEEDDILSQQGRDRVVEIFEEEAAELAGGFTGAAAVDAADTTLNLRSAAAPLPAQPLATQAAGGGNSADEDGGFVDQRDNLLQTVKGKTFILRDDVWVDTAFEPDAMETEKVVFLSDAYFDLLTANPEIGEYLAIGEQLIVVIDDTAYEIVTE